MINFKNSIAIIAMGFIVAICGLVLMTVSQKVYDTQRTVQMMDKEKLATEWEIRALQAELAYLSRPERLEQISSAIRHNHPVSKISGEEPAYLIAPVSYTLSNNEDSASGTIIPLSKPQRQVSVEHSSQPVQQNVQTQNFDSLLNYVGGVEQ